MRIKTILGFVDLAIHRSPVLCSAVFACFVKGSFMITPGEHLCDPQFSPCRITAGCADESISAK